jgi:hypothetical protein
VNAYNHHDADVFAEIYASDATIARANAPALQTRQAINATYRDLFTKNPAIHAEILGRDVNGETVVDKERVTGFSDGRDALEATVTYHVRNGTIAGVQVAKTA